MLIVLNITESGAYPSLHQMSPLQRTPGFGKQRKELSLECRKSYAINLLKPTGHVMHQQFNIQQLYVLPTLYLCVLYLTENK